MASKDEYYQRIIASLQADISSQNRVISDLKSTVDRQQKEIEALKASPVQQRVPISEKLSGAEKARMLQQARNECDTLIQSRIDSLNSRYAYKRELNLLRNSVETKFLSADIFTAYQKGQESRLKSIEEKLHRPFSLLTIHHHSQTNGHSTKSYFNLDPIVSILKKISLRWLLSILVFLGMCGAALFLFRSITA